MVASNKDSKVKKHFVDLVTNNFKDKNTTIELTDIHNVYISMAKNLTLQIDGKNVSDYDLVIFRGIKSTDQSLASSISMCLKYLNINFVDKVYGEMGISEKKLGSFIKLYTSGIKLPRVVFVSKPTPNEELFNKIKDEIGLPFVAKDLYLQRGKGVFLISNLSEFVNLPVGREHLFQEFLDKKHEYRVLVLGKKVGVYEEKISDNVNEFRNNVALGAREVFFDKAEIPNEIRDISIKSAESLNLQIAGVDIVVDKKGDIYILEVNRGPGLTYDNNLSPEFREIADFFENYE